MPLGADFSALQSSLWIVNFIGAMTDLTMPLACGLNGYHFVHFDEAPMPVKNLPLIAAVFFAFALWFGAGAGSAEAAACQGLSKTRCTANDECVHVDGYTRNDGVSVGSYCRNKSGGGTSPATASSASKTKKAKAEKAKAAEAKEKKAKAKKKTSRKSKGTTT